MASTINRRTDDQWEELISRFLASNLTQTEFCLREDISRFSFGPRYQRSPQFVGKRRERRARTTSLKSNFRRVTPRSSSPPPVGSSTMVQIRIGESVHIEAAGEIALQAIVRLAAEARS